MNSFQTHITVESAGQLVLRGLPFKPGEKVRVVVESERSIEERRLLEKKRALELFQSIAARTDTNDRFQSLTEADITEEIAAYRRGE
jgi:predicted DNA-binding antitoxin AbrB/MazE fold protein